MYKYIYVSIYLHIQLEYSITLLHFCRHLRHCQERERERERERKKRDQWQVRHSCSYIKRIYNQTDIVWLVEQANRVDSRQATSHLLSVTFSGKVLGILISN